MFLSYWKDSDDSDDDDMFEQSFDEGIDGEDDFESNCRHEIDSTLDEMITVVEEWKRSSNVISCETLLGMLMARKSK